MKEVVVTSIPERVGNRRVLFGIAKLRGEFGSAAGASPEPKPGLGLKFTNEGGRKFHGFVSPRGQSASHQLRIGDACGIERELFRQFECMLELAAQSDFRIEPAAPAEPGENGTTDQSFLVMAKLAAAQRLAKDCVGRFPLRVAEDLFDNTKNCSAENQALARSCRST